MPMEALDEKKVSDYLLIEADPIASNARQIEHCRCICERMRHEYILKCASNPAFANSSPKKHIIFTVHLSRNAFDFSSFLLDFDKKWHCVFIDAVALAEKSGLPELANMLNKPLKDVVESVDFQYVLTNQCLRPSLARLIYSSKRGASELKAQIQTLLDLCKHPEFVSLLRNLVMDVMDEKHKSDEKEYQKRLQIANAKRGANQSQMGGSSSSSAAAASPMIEGLGSAQDSENAAVFRQVWYSEDVEAMAKAGTFCGALHSRNHAIQLFATVFIRDHCLKMADYVVTSSTCVIQQDMMRSLVAKEASMNNKPSN